LSTRDSDCAPCLPVSHPALAYTYVYGAERREESNRVQMSDAERERFYRRYTRNGAAYERYLMGRARLRALTEQGVVQAVAEFEAAISIPLTRSRTPG
jgi:hypothetical protein